MKLPDKFSALKFGNYRQYIFGQLISLSGTYMHRMAQAWLIYSLTDSALMIGAVTFVAGITKVIGGPVAGAFADMFERKKLLIWIEFFCMVPTLTFSGLYFLDKLQLWHIFILAALQGLGNAAELIGRHAVAGDLVPREHLSSALNVNSSFTNLAKMIGPAIGGYVLYRYGEGMCFLLNGFSYIFVIVSLLLMKIEKVKPQSGANVLKKIQEAAVYIYNDSKLLSLISIVGFIYALGSPMLTILTVYTRVLYAGDANILSYMLTAGAVGGLMGVLLLDTILKKADLPVRISAFLGMLGLAYIGLGLSSAVPIAVVSSFFVGFCFLGMWPILNTTIQSSCDDSIRGRVVSFVQITIFTCIPLGDLAVGLIIDWQTAPFAALTFGAMSIAVGATILFRNSLAAPLPEHNFGFFKSAAMFATVFFLTLILLKSFPQIGPPALKVMPPVVKFKVATAKKTSARTIKIQGETRPFSSTHIYPKVSGFISEMNVNIGDFVKKDQVVAVLNLPDISRELDVALNQEKIALEYFQRLSEMNSRKSIQLDLELAKAKSAIEIAQSNRREVEFKMEQAQVKAPYDGKITARFVDTGTYVGNELSLRPQPVVTIIRQDKLRVYAYVDQKNATKLAVGQSATIRLPENSSVAIESKIVRTAGELEPKSKTLLTELVIDNEKDHILPNSHVEVEFRISRDETLQIPAQAIEYVGNKTFVTIVDPYYVIQRREIKVDSIDGDNATVKEGMRENEMVALGAEAYEKGIRIIPRTEVLTVGFLSIGREEPTIFIQLRKTLQEMGYVEGKNLQIVDESRTEDYYLLPYALERIKEKQIDIIVTFGSTAKKTALNNAEGIPVVSVSSTDPVLEGYAQSYDKPGGMLTGVRTRNFELGPERLRTLLEMMPKMAGVNVLYAPRAAGQGPAVKELVRFSKKSLPHLEVLPTPVNQIQDLEWVIERAIAENPNYAMLIMTSTMLAANMDQIMEILNRHNVPTIGMSGTWNDKGALFSIGAQNKPIAKWIAGHVDKIFKGTYPGNIPIEESSETELTLNLNTAQKFGATVHDSILKRADRVIDIKDSTFRTPADQSQ